MTPYEIITKLVGPIHPVGESHTDGKRFKNLEETIDLVESLLFDLEEVAGNANRQEHSLNKAGKRAKEFLEELEFSE